MRAAGVVVLSGLDPNQRKVALLRRQGAVCLPRVLIRPDEASLDVARRALHAQVSSSFDGSDWQHLSEVHANVSGQPLSTEYWSANASDANLPLHADCFWLPLALAADQLAFSEERKFLLALEDPLVQSSPTPVDHGPTSLPEEPEHHLPPISPSQVPKRRWAFDPHRGRLAEAIAAARSQVKHRGTMGDWRESALQHLRHAEESVQAGEVEAAQESLTSAWRLDLESRSVGERRLMTQLLRGEVRANTNGWLKDSLLTAIQDSPDAGTMALVRSELEKQNRLTSAKETQNQLGRLSQLVVAVPVSVGLFVASSTSWLDGGATATGDIMPATLGLGMLGGLGWTLARRQLGGYVEALVPLGVGAVAARFGLLLAKSGILTIGQDSVPLMLCLSVLWGLGAAAVVDWKRSAP